MPKETFPDARGSWTSTTGSNDPKVPDVEMTVDLALELSWGVESMVHVSSVNQADDGPTRGWFVELDRAAINRLVKSLRKARDQAYGPDE